MGRARARRGGPRIPSTTTDANLDCAFVENALYFIDPLEFTKKPGGPKIIPTIFLTADSKTENNPDIIFDS